MKSFNLQDFIKDTQKLENGLSESGIFTLKTASEFLKDAANRPIPKSLFDEFWFEGEICILFSDTNLGKSILAVQIADSLSKGVPIQGFSLEAVSQKIILFDFELSDKQFENRYSKDYQDHYTFDEKFYRVEINPDADIPEGDPDQIINQEIERAIQHTGAKILIIDNITYLRDETEKSKAALPLMKHLKALKQKYHLSILMLSHTPKIDPYKPLGRNHLQGSRMLLNFCDSCFVIGQSFTDDRLRYLKQIKVRNCEHRYTAENICVCEIKKPGNMVQLEFISYGDESEHLKESTGQQRKQRAEEAAKLKAEGMSNVEIAKKFQVSEGAVRKWLK